MDLIKVLLNNDIHKTPRYISESSFDSSTMKRIEDDNEEVKLKAESNLKEMLSKRKAPGIVMGGSKRPSLYHNHKLDSGAVGDLLDVGLDGAKKRAVNRNKKMGHSFRKNKILKRRKRK